MKKLDLFGKVPLPGCVINCTFLMGCVFVTLIAGCFVDERYKFPGGLWHGVFAPFSFVCSLFINDVAKYAVTIMVAGMTSDFFRAP